MIYRWNLRWDFSIWEICGADARGRGLTYLRFQVDIMELLFPPKVRRDNADRYSKTYISLTKQLRSHTHQARISPLALQVHLKRHLTRLLDSSLLIRARSNIALLVLLIKELPHRQRLVN